MNYGKAFSYVFEDSDWVSKLLIGGLLFLGGCLLVPLFFPLGYMVETIQNVIEKRTPILPEWDNWGEKFTKGAILFVINLVYQLPGFLISGLQTGLDIASQESGSASASMALSGPILFFSCLRIVYSLFAAFIQPAIIIQYTTTEKFEAAFRFKEIYEFIKDNIGDYFVVVVVSIAAGIVGMLGIIACCIGVAFTIFYAQLVNSHLYAQLYRESAKTNQLE